MRLHRRRFRDGRNEFQFQSSLILGKVYLSVKRIDLTPVLTIVDQNDSQPPVCAKSQHKAKRESGRQAGL